MTIRKFLGLGGPPAAEETAGQGDTETVRKITRELERLDPDRARFLACYAYLLGRVAHADLEISDEETAAMERLVREEGGISEEQAVLVVHMARSQNVLFGGTENFLVARELAKVADAAAKRSLLRCLFAVSASDESVSVAEENEIRRIAAELGLEHADYIAARMAFREHLSVLRRPPGAKD